VGAAFLTKLLVALIVLPALWLTYMVFAPRPWRIRILHLLAGSAVVVAISAGWVLAVDRTPLASRPWIGSSTDGSAADLVLGYNGIGRITGADQGAGGGTFPGGGFGGAFGGGIDQFGGEPGVTRLFNAGMGDQVMWLAPLAATAAVAGLYGVARHRRRDTRAAAVVLFSGWAATTFVVFSFAQGIFHNYYVSLLAPAIAALVGIGVSQLRQAGRRGRTVAAVAVAVTAGLQLVLLRRVEAYTWLRPTVTITLLAVTAGLGWSAWRRERDSQRTITGLVGAGVALVLVAPTVWSWAGDRYAPAGTFPDARPATSSTLGGVSGQGGFAAFGGTGGGLDEAMLAWLRNEQEEERWIVAVGSVQQASAAIIAGDSVMPMGGFTGSDPAMTTDRLTTLVRDGDLRFVLTGGFGLGGGGALTAVTNACTEVPPTTWGADGEQPAGGTGGGSTLYDCQDKADAIAQASETAPSDADTTTPGGGFPGGVDTDELERCLSEQGVTLPDSGDGMPDVTDPDLAAALQECGLPAAAGESAPR
jgi:4-amino-4-deoxy-L-arabinose transferase-like glycosyltransferase